jgi:hypothetical protein
MDGTQTDEMRTKTSLNLDRCTQQFFNQVKDVQQMIKGVVSSIFIVLNKLPRHLSVSKCYLQRVTLSLHKQLQFLVCV